MKLLVVDDSTTMRRIIMNCLRQIGEHDIVEAEDGADALHKLDVMQGADLILTDWNTPNVDGLEFLKQVKAGVHRAVPVIMVTTEAEKLRVLARSATELTAISGHLAEGSRNMTGQANSVAGATEDMSTTISSMASATEEMSGSMREIRTSAQEGRASPPRSRRCPRGRTTWPRRSRA
jgi:two-component system chemotaxis response regulator CheY